MRIIFITLTLTLSLMADVYYNFSLFSFSASNSGVFESETKSDEDIATKILDKKMGFGGPMVYGSYFNDYETYAVGGMGAKLYPNGFYLGGGGAGGGSDESGVGYGFGGLIIGYNILPSWIINLSADVMLGGYGLGTADSTSQGGLYGEAKANLNLRLLPFMRISAGVGLRYYDQLYKIGLPDRQEFATVAIQFGKYSR
jgi:hypothetical protein